ncbi:hypothetical protein PVAP13_5KG711401 [Panicum virgatum]|uniref:Uncharacterized protein n=1 Tax=Panicum virgatum TaxID=38727 RepID=A0A8T0SXK9_PANVG|nr:hypothetical protein PVAP13_5KG711401 [Panicum virgatum]
MNALYNVVRVSRTWEFRGKSENNPLIHFDMVLIDQMGYAVYCEVPPQVLDQLKQYLQEGKVLYIYAMHVLKGLYLDLELWMPLTY